MSSNYVFYVQKMVELKLRRERTRPLRPQLVELLDGCVNVRHDGALIARSCRDSNAARRRLRAANASRAPRKPS